MYQVPTPYWNEIAATQPLRTARWKPIFSAKDLTSALAPLESKLEAAGMDARTIRAYLLVAPLLEENLAVTRWLEQTERPDLRNSMPELVSVDEAMRLASQEFSLMTSQAARLRQRLQADLQR